MPVVLNYKGFAFEDAIQDQPPERSAELAVGTYYHCWFEVLKRSPWYLKELQGGYGNRSDTSRMRFQFGDITNIDFKTWWIETGYRIFSEGTPYEAVQQLSVQPIRPTKLTKQQKKQNALMLSLPLNLAKEEVLRQVERAFEIAQQDLQRRVAQAHENANSADGFNRHVFSSAEVYLYDDNRLKPSVIWENLKFYYKYVEERRNLGRQYKQYEFAAKVGLAGKKSRDTPAKSKASNAVSDKLKGIYYLMNYASRGVFPCNDEIRDLKLTEIDVEFFDPNGSFMYGDIAEAKGAWPKSKTGRMLDIAE